MKKLILILTITLMSIASNSQNTGENTKVKKTAAILSMDANGVGYDDKQMGNLLRLELEKMDTFQVVDRYDLNYFLEKKALQLYDSVYKPVCGNNPRKADSCYKKAYFETQSHFENCFSKACLIDMGQIVGSDKMLTGTAEKFGELIVVTLRLIDVKQAYVEKTQVNEYLYLPNEVALMIRLSLQQLLNKSYDAELLKTISKKNNYESSLNNHNKVSVKLNGPRSGFTVFTGKSAEILKEKRENGGFDADPVMFQFGYQFEKQYLNEGNCQALFEFLPTITGFNQNIFIPSLTIMNGFRENKYGWEIAFGPSFSLITKADVYQDSTGHWALAREWNSNDFGPNPYKVINRVDSRGNLELNSFFIVAIGKTFRSGRLNIPLNAYVIPSRDGWRFGMSVGFNAKKINHNL